MNRYRWSPCLVALLSGLVSADRADAQYAPARPNAGFAMVYPGQTPDALLPAASPVSATVHPHWGPTWTNSGAAAVPVRTGSAQPKYGWDAYPYPGPDGRKAGLREGCANPITCGNFFSDATFVFGSCRQYFGHGRGCGGWHTHGSRHADAENVTTDGSATGCTTCDRDYWSR